MELVIVIACLLVNALLACLEMAFVSVGRPQLRDAAKGGRSDAKRLLALRNNPERTLSVIQIGITLVGAISAAVGGAGAEEVLAPRFQNHFGWSEGTAEAIAILCVVIPLTYFSVVLGELVPKAIALRAPMPIALKGSRWLALGDKLLGPIVSVLEWSTKQMLRLIPNRHPPTRESHDSDVDKIRTLSDQHRQYVVNLASLEEKRVREVLVPWSNAVWVGSDASAEKVTEVFTMSGFSRIPVMEQMRCIGFVYGKEFFALIRTGEKEWKNVLRPILVVQDTDTLLKVLRLMQDKRSQLALVAGVRGETTGIVTLEDIMEEVVGEIYDEDDDGSLKKILSSGGKFRLWAWRSDRDAPARRETLSPVAEGSPVPQN